MAILTRVLVVRQGSQGGGAVPPPTAPGDMIMSLDGTTWATVRPVVGGEDGWLNNADGDLLIEGVVP